MPRGAVGLVRSKPALRTGLQFDSECSGQERRGGSGRGALRVARVPVPVRGGPRAMQGLESHLLLVEICLFRNLGRTGIRQDATFYVQPLSLSTVSPRPVRRAAGTRGVSFSVGSRIRRVGSPHVLHPLPSWWTSGRGPTGSGEVMSKVAMNTHGQSSTRTRVSLHLGRFLGARWTRPKSVRFTFPHGIRLFPKRSSVLGATRQCRRSCISSLG